MVTMALLLLPKLLGLISALFRADVYRGPGRIRLCLSFMIELLFSILHAPVVMLMHTRHLWEIARGQDSGWSAQQRQSGRVDWRNMLARHGSHTLVGVLMLMYLLWVSSALLYWMLPMITGLILSIPLSALSGSRSAGRWLARKGMLLTPEECAPPAIIRRRHALLDNA